MREGQARAAPGTARLVLGIDPALEEDLELLVDAGLPEPALESVFTAKAGRWPS